jgi:hypothetical protein
MEDLILPSVGPSFRKWGCYTPIFSKGLAHSLDFPKKIKEDKIIFKKGGHSLTIRGLRSWPGALNPPFAKKKSSSYPVVFAYVVNSCCWLQYMPALSKPPLKISNTHNFLYVGSEIMEFVFP